MYGVEIMKKFICMIVAMLICMSLAVPAFAATGAFTPSVTVKTGAEIVPVKVDGEKADAAITTADGETVAVVDDCLLLTSVADAKKKNSELEKLDKEAHENLLKVYKDLESGKMEIPYADFKLKADKMAIRDLFDATFICAGQAENDHDAILAEDKASMEVTLDLGVAKKDKVHVFVYTENADGEMEWVEIDVVNNGNGTVTLTFEALGVVAICIEK